MDNNRKANRMSERLACGVVGVGSLGQHHARIYNELDGCELAGVYDADPERAKEIAAVCNCAVFTSLAEVAAACDAVSVVVPTQYHAEVSLQLLEGDCHLLIEKPLCSTRAEAAAIVEAARKHNRIVQVGHIEQYNPVMDALREAVFDPRFITADRLAPFNVRGTEVGVVLDLMIHDIGVILELVPSPVERVESVGVPVLSGSEDIANARITFANGCVANLNTSRVSQKKVREIRVFQPNTYLSLDFMNQKGHLLRKSEAGLLPEEVPIENGEPLMLELEAFLNCIGEAAVPRVDAKRGYSALELALQITEQIHAAYESRPQ